MSAFEPTAFASRLPLPATAKWPEGVFDIEAFADGALVLRYFAPRGLDRQTAHDRDEVYVIVAGHAVFERDGHAPVPVGPDSALVVPRGIEHRFRAMSADFGAGVVFGPAEA